MAQYGPCSSMTCRLALQVDYEPTLISMYMYQDVSSDQWFWMLLGLWIQELRDVYRIWLWVCQVTGNSETHTYVICIYIYKYLYLFILTYIYMHKYTYTNIYLHNITTSGFLRQVHVDPNPSHIVWGETLGLLRRGECCLDLFRPLSILYPPVQSLPHVEMIFPLKPRFIWGFCS